MPAGSKGLLAQLGCVLHTTEGQGQKHFGGLRQLKDFDTGAVASSAVCNGLTSPGANAKS